MGEEWKESGVDKGERREGGLKQISEYEKEGRTGMGME